LIVRSPAAREVPVGRAEDGAVLDGQRGQSGIGDETARDLGAVDQVPQDVPEAIARIDGRNRGNASHAETAASASAVVSGYSKTRGFVLILRKATMVAHEMRMASPLANSASTHARRQTLALSFAATSSSRATVGAPAVIERHDVLLGT
jgi:hypothetical protein